MKKIKLLFGQGKVLGLYEDRIIPVLKERLGAKAQIRRASHVEAPEGELDSISFQADLRPSGGPVLTGFPTYAKAVEAEVEWIQENVLTHGARK